MKNNLFTATKLHKSCEISASLSVYLLRWPTFWQMSLKISHYKVN